MSSPGNISSPLFGEFHVMGELDFGIIAKMGISDDSGGF